MKLASWNVNSLKIRLEQVLSWMDSAEIDILALQETKVPDALFPRDAFTERGWFIAYAGQKAFNGVAIISRMPIQDIVTDLVGFDDPQRRILAVTINGLRLINLYVPNGAAVDSDKYQYKLLWLKHVRLFILQELQRYPQLAVVGDFNIAPEDRDVFDPIACLGQVLVSPDERAAFADLLALGLYDSFRQVNQATGQYTWWDYRAAAFRRNRGLRIDHILISQALKECCIASDIAIELRRTERPSDHAPIWSSFA